MRWPFVTRKSMQEAVATRDALISRLEQKLDAIEHERKLLCDRVVFGHSGIHLYPEFTPARPVSAARVEEPDTQFMEKKIPTTANEVMAQGVVNPRQIVRSLETSLAEKFVVDRASGKYQARQDVAKEADKIISTGPNGPN